MQRDLVPRPRRSSFLGLELSAFVGREHELEDVRGAVGASRLVSLVGEGGVGKTRLAQRYVERREREGASSTILCELSGARHVDAMTAALARALSVERVVVGGEAGVTAIGRALALVGATLVVLDNVEQLLPAAGAAIVRWLDLAPEAHFLVTSREPLYVPGEEIVDIGPLPLVGLPGRESDAARLFVERVRSFRKGYAPAGDEPRLVEELVRRIRGVPLAIELCASHLGTGELRALVGTGGSAARSEHAAVAWAFRKLGPWERSALAQLSVFRGGFTMAAAEAVVALPPASGAVSVPAALVRLLERSLLHAARVDQEVRYAIAQGLHDPAAELLDQSVELADAPWRHARYYLELAAQNEGAANRETLLAERENVEAALEFGAASGRRDIVLRAAVALDFISSGSGLTRAQLALLDAALGQPGNLEPTMVGRALGVRAGALRAMGKLDEAERDAKSALTLAREAGNTREVVAMLHAIGNARFQCGDIAQAMALSQEALAETRAHGERSWEAMALQQLGSVLLASGHLASGAANIEAALELAIAIGDEVAEARAAMGLAFFSFERGQPARAEELWRHALGIAERLGMERNVRITLGYLGMLAFDGERCEEAERLLADSTHRSRAAGDPSTEGVFEGIRGAALARLGCVAEARAAFALALELLVHNAYYREVIELFAGHLDLAEAREARARGDDGEAQRLLAAVERRMANAELGGATPPLVRRSDDARIALRTLRRARAELDPQTR